MTSTDPIMAGTTFSHNTAEANGVRLHYVMGGKGDPVVLLHGWTQTSHSWHKVMPLLAKSHTVIAPDMRGFGDSEKPPAGYDGRTVAEDVHQLVKGLGFERYYLVGHDVGVWVAYALAASYPAAVRALTLLDSPVPGIGGFDDLSAAWHMPFHTARDVAEMLVAGKEREYLSYFYRTYSYDPTAISEKDVDEYVRCYAAPGGLRGGFEYYRAFFEDVEQNRQFNQEKLSMPVQTLVGGAGPGSFLTESLKGIGTDMRSGSIESCGHFIPDERPEELAEQLLEFFGEAATAREGESQ